MKPFALCLAWFTLLAGSALAQDRGALAGRVTDPSGAVIPGVRVRLAEQAGRFEQVSETDEQGSFRFESVPEGEYRLSATETGFAPLSRMVSVSAGEERRADISFALAALAEETVVSARRIADIPELIPGSVSTLDWTTLETSHVFTTSEALRKAPGMNVRDEEGFGLRPNIGIRGVNPTRSTKVLLLEDGIPLSYAPYGDNASYYHPPIDRFDSIEIVKGAGQILYGPATVSGVVNYLTPSPPAQPSGSLSLQGGNRDYFNGRLNWGGTWGNTGLLADVIRKQGQGARENQRFGLTDINLKALIRPDDRQSLVLKGNYYGEDSNVGYSGLREGEYLLNPRQNPFRNDAFLGDRLGGLLSHSVVLANHAVLSTNLYGSLFKRHWWRQSSNSNERPNDASCGGMANLNTTCGIQGRLREYTTWGVEPHVRLNHSLLGLRNDTDFGFRVHFEHQDRRQENGARPTSRTGAIVESNIRRNTAFSAFVQNRFGLGHVAVTPGVRVEHIDYERTNNLGNGGAGVSGRTSLTQVVPGIGVAYNVNDQIVAFGGIHRGFAPPRTEDIINNTTGGAVELDSELSWNYEAGLRGRPHPSLGLEATFFTMDYENQVVPASLAGGSGALLTNGGSTLHRGLEFSGRFDAVSAFSSQHNLYLRSAYTFVPVARYTGTRFSSISGSTTSRVTGNRLSYAPRHTVNSTVGYRHPSGVDGSVEAVVVSGQFGDDLNSPVASANGQTGPIPAYTIWNAALNHDVEAIGSTVFVTVKNLFDRTYIVDRSRGILPSSPRLIQAGIKIRF